jgi:type VI secretion system secreted protein Hcp
MAADIFAKLGGIKGESNDAKHKDEIEVLSYSWGVTKPVLPASSGGGAGKASFQDLVIVHRIDKASPMLMEACATGKHLNDATITHRKDGKQPFEYLIVKLNDVQITAVTHDSANNQPDTGSEKVSLTFTKVALEYRPQRLDGSADPSIYFKHELKHHK